MTKTFKKEEQIRTFTIKDNKVLTFINNVANPTIEQMYKWGWEDYEYPPQPSYEPTYEEKLEQLVEQKLRRKYSLNQELHIARISRQLVKTEEELLKIAEFDEYAQECVDKAKEELGPNPNEQTQKDTQTNINFDN